MQLKEIQTRENEKQEEFMTLYRPCHDAFCRYCHGLTGNRDDAVDLVGETILAALENFEKLRKKESFKAWIFGIARRLMLHAYRRNKFNGRFREGDAHLLTDPESSPDIHPDVALLYNALDKLPLKQREAIVLFELSGLSLEEIRRIQGGSLSGVKTRLKRSREKLRAILGDKESSMLKTKNPEGRK
jgi:RNA polymerase sigma-70 factor (ECF subfamily)